MNTRRGVLRSSGCAVLAATAGCTTLTESFRGAERELETIHVRNYGDQPSDIEIRATNGGTVLYETVETVPGHGDGDDDPGEVDLNPSEEIGGARRVGVIASLDGRDARHHARPRALREILGSCPTLTITVDRWDTPIAFGRACE